MTKTKYTYTDCRECEDRIQEEFRSLEANVDQKYLLAHMYQTSVRNGIRRCSIHGSDKSA